jgi:hypothetical protein
MKSEDVYSYQKALKRRVRMYEEFKAKHGRNPTDKEIGTMPRPPVDLVEGFRSGEIRYETPEEKRKLAERQRLEYNRAKNRLWKEKRAKWVAEFGGVK